MTIFCLVAHQHVPIVPSGAPGKGVMDFMSSKRSRTFGTRSSVILFMRQDYAGCSTKTQPAGLTGDAKVYCAGRVDCSLIFTSIGRR
jgi:hypothetical protein